MMDDNDGRRCGNRQKTGTDGKAVNKAVLRKNNPGKKQRQSQQAKVKQKIQRQFAAAVIKNICPGKILFHGAPPHLMTISYSIMKQNLPQSE